MKSLDVCVPRFTPAEVERLVVTSHGLRGKVEPLPGERDQNFRLREENGDSCVVKIVNAGEDAAAIDAQIAVLQHIERVDPSLPVPRVRSGLSGALVLAAADSEGVRHIYYILSWLPGIVADEVQASPELLTNHGRMVARLGRAMRGFFHPAAGRRELVWDLRMLPRLLPHAQGFSDPNDRDLVIDIGERFSGLASTLQGLRAQFIHGDVHPANFLVNPGDPDQIAGIIDFGDVIHGALIQDLASAAGESLYDKENVAETVLSITTGYNSVSALEPCEVEILCDMILARLAVVAIVNMSRGLSQKGVDATLAAIRKLQEIGRSEITRRLQRACGVNGMSFVSTVTPETLIGRRERLMGAKTPLFYQPPLHLVRGEGVWLTDSSGRRYLDVYNNVPHVGHCHPAVTSAIARQAATLNTNTRYLGDQVLQYCERLGATFAGKLKVCAFVNSGSEANDLAWRMAKAHTGNFGGLCIDFAYHGVTEASDSFSPSASLHGRVAPHIRTLLAPDDYRGPYKRGNSRLAELYAASADHAIASLREGGMEPAAFIVDSLFLTNGVLEAPEPYLASVFEKVRAVGCLCIADEVQAGFGRTGSCMWGHQRYNVIPDIVTLGKPAGNGHPIGVVITTPEIMESFQRETVFFSTFGGNNVSCAAGLAVLDVLEQEALMENARKTGAYLKQGLKSLMNRHEIIGDVRGIGLTVGVELVLNKELLTPATEQTAHILNLMRDEGILIGSDGPLGNVLKLRPPLVFGREHAELVIDALDRVLYKLPDGALTRDA